MGRAADIASLFRQDIKITTTTSSPTSGAQDVAQLHTCTTASTARSHPSVSVSFEPQSSTLREAYPEALSNAVMVPVAIWPWKPLVPWSALVTLRRTKLYTCFVILMSVSTLPTVIVMAWLGLDSPVLGIGVMVGLVIMMIIKTTRCDATMFKALVRKRAIGAASSRSACSFLTLSSTSCWARRSLTSSSVLSFAQEEQLTAGTRFQCTPLELSSLW